VSDRARITRAWANDAAMEHASIASFARFVLDLLSVGAQHELVGDAQAAMRDEIEHARACFAIASAYAGRALGPGRLDVSGTTTAPSLADAAAAAVLEGCIGETLSAALAHERASGAKDDATRRTLTTIAEDEARHAELAWRFVGWALLHGDSEVRVRVEAAFAGAPFPAAFDGVLRGIPTATLRAHGLLDETTAQAIAAGVMRDVVEPCRRRAAAA
jgi:hypothetical protein